MIELRCAPPDLPPTEVRIGRGAARLAPLGDADAAFVIDRAVLAAHPALRPATEAIAVGGAGVKSFAVLEAVLRELARRGLDRRATVVAVGGGAVGDLGGLAAALFLRGVDLIQVPTTLLAMVDAGVGGKTAIDLPEGKNLVGQVWPARQVLVDPDLLSSLPAAELESGLGELLKVAIGLDSGLFRLLGDRPAAARAGDPDLLTAAIERSLRAKIAVVEADPRERGPRRLLNLGHTLGHALEAEAAGRLPHGAAVARGLHAALEVADRLGAIEVADLTACRDLLERFGFAAWPLPPRLRLEGFLRRDKKREGGALHFVVPTGIGRCRTVPIAFDELLSMLAP